MVEGLVGNMDSHDPAYEPLVERSLALCCGSLVEESNCVFAVSNALSVRSEDLIGLVDNSFDIGSRVWVVCSVNWLMAVWRFEKVGRLGSWLSSSSGHRR